MKKFNKLLGFIVVFFAVMVAFCTVSFAANTQQMDLSKWESVQLTNTGDAPNWKLDSSKTSVTQTNNSRPSVLLGDIQCVNSKVEGSFSVDSTNDDDFIGFVFGYKDSGHFYLFDWKQTDQYDTQKITFAKKGMCVKLVNTGSSLVNKELWDSSGGDKIKVLYRNDIAYEDNTIYNFTLNFTGKGIFNIVVKQGDIVLDDITITDNTYTSGKFGFYNYSQEMVTYKGFTLVELPPVLKITSVDKVKVDLSWDTVEGATSYNVKRSTSPGGPYDTIVSNVTGTNYTDTDVTNGTTYYYIVSAVVNGIEGENSNEVSATPMAPQPTNQLKLVLEVNQEKQLSVSEELSDNTEMDWISSDTSIATVDSNGKVKALKPGNTVITCTSKDKSYTESINVLVIDLEYQLAVDLSIGDTCRLTIDDLTNTDYVTWSSYDPTIANVSAKGKVTAVSEGLTYAVASDKDGKEIGRIYVRVRQ